MTNNVMGSFRWAEACAVLAAAMIASPAAAQSVVTDNSPSAGDIAMTPIEDLNLKKDPIPAVLLAAAQSPYANPGLKKCSQIREEIAGLDAVLGEDFDTAAQPSRKLTAGKVALGLVTGLIPYRGIIRQLSGAADHEFQFKQAISAGLMRRAYLKGLGEATKCPYPARPMAQPVGIIPAERTAGEPVFVSYTVEQPLPRK